MNKRNSSHAYSNASYFESIRVGKGFGELYSQTMNDADGVRSGLEMREFICRMMLEYRGMVMDIASLRLCGYTQGKDSCNHCGVLRAVYPFEFTRRDHCASTCYLAEIDYVDVEL